MWSWITFSRAKCEAAVAGDVCSGVGRREADEVAGILFSRQRKV